jgi:hypothetical protein
MQDSVEFVTRSVAPLTQRIRALTPEEIPAAFRAFSEDQQTLFMFCVLHTHAGDGLRGFGRELPHRLASPGFRQALLECFQRIGDIEMRALMERWFALVGPALPLSGTTDISMDVDAMDQVRTRLDQLDPEAMAALDAEYRRLLPDAFERMAQHLRTRTGQVRG